MSDRRGMGAGAAYGDVVCQQSSWRASLKSGFNNLNLFASKGPYANKGEVLACIESAEINTQQRLSTTPLVATDMRQAGQECLQGIKDLGRAVATDAVKWQNFGGFTGYAQDNLAVNWAPKTAGFNEYHGWIDYSKKGDEAQETIFDSAKEALFSTKSAQSRGGNGITARLSRFFKGTDGWDELGSGIGQTLPGIGQHLATSVILGVLSPFVYLGVVGMKEEMDERKEALKAILDKDQDSKQKVIEMMALARSMLKIDENGQADALSKAAAQSDKAFESLAYEQAHQIQLAADKQSARMAYEATPYGLAAMFGMFGGMLAGTTAATLEVADAATSASVAALGSLAEVFGALTAGLFIPAQLAMIVYGGRKAKEGELICQSLQKQSDAVSHLKIAHQNDPERKSNRGSALFDAALDNMQRLRKYHYQGKVVYGRGIQVSEAGMVAGGVMSLVGLGLAGIATLIPAALFTIGFAAYRIFQEDKLENFEGEKIEDLALEKENGELASDPSDDFDKPIALERLEKKHAQVTNDLAESKVHSLLLRSLTRKRWHERILSWLPDALKLGRWSFFRRTSLAKDVLQTMSGLYSKDPYIHGLMHISTEDKTAGLMEMARRVFKWSEKTQRHPHDMLADAVDALATSELLDNLKTRMVRVEIDDPGSSKGKQKVLKLSGAELLQRVLRDKRDKGSPAETGELEQCRDALMLAALSVKVKDDKFKLKGIRQAIFKRVVLHAHARKLKDDAARSTQLDETLNEMRDRAAANSANLRRVWPVEAYVGVEAANEGHDQVPVERAVPA